MELDAMKIITRYTTRSQFIGAFRELVDPTTCFVPTSDAPPIGISTAFSIGLADGTPLLRGHGVILDAWRTEDNRFGRPGVHVGIHRLSDDSTELFAELLAPSSTVTRLPVAIQLRLLNDSVPSSVALETPTIEMPPLQNLDAPRLQGAVFTLPANPLTDVSDERLGAFVDGAVAKAEQQPVPEELHAETTEPNPVPSHDTVATLLGMVPLAPPRVYAAPTPVVTELVDRVRVARPPTRRRRAVLAPVRRRWHAVLAPLRPRWLAAIAVALVALGLAITQG